MTSNRWLIAAIVIASVATAGVGCTPGREDPDSDYPTALAEVDDLLGSVQDLIGGEWEVMDRGAADCPLPSGAIGASSQLTRFGQGVPLEQHEALVEQVTAIWTEAGFVPVRGEEPSREGRVRIRVAYPQAGTDENGMYLLLRFSERSSAIEGRTRCVPGDSAEINTGEI